MRCTMTCPGDDTILCFLGGLLQPEDGGRVEQHLDRCPRCRRLFSNVARVLVPAPTRGTLGGCSEDGAASHEQALENVLPAGSIVGHFRVIRLLGRGGTAEVYLAEDTRLGREVALKTVRSGALISRQIVDRFMDEARITARLNHPRIVTIYEVSEDVERPHLALEYIHGQSLQQRIDSRRPPLHEAIRIALDIALALDAAHGRGILHCDLKPGNVVLDRENRAKVVDFGLARAFGDGTLAGPDGRQRCLCGSPAFMAPEQWRCQEPTGATDIWALGVIMFMMFSGRHPYQELSLRDLARRVCSGSPAPTLVRGSTAPELGWLVDQCLQQDPQRRPSARQVATRLGALVNLNDAQMDEPAPPPLLRAHC